LPEGSIALHNSSFIAFLLQIKVVSYHRAFCSIPELKNFGESMKKAILLWSTISILSISSISPAQISTSGLQAAQGLDKTVYGLGLSAGLASGFGVSFRAHFPSKSSVQAVFGIIKTNDKTALSIGGEYQYDLVRGNTTRFFFGPAASFNYLGAGHNELSGPFRVGVGIGGEFKVRESFHVSAEAMFVFFSDGTVLPLPQLAMHYYFF
jgi:hypothetical protein